METVVIEQYRIPARSKTIRFPAGLVDANETSKEVSIRELKEETGYVSCRAKVFWSRELRITPGMVDEIIKAVVVHVDLDDRRNMNPTSEPDIGKSLLQEEYY